MGKIELAGTIGTWVAVFFAVVALVGIVGPFLVWRASRTERQIALKAVDSELAENGGFMTRGLQLWPGIRLFRRVRAPLLRGEPTLNATNIINRNSNAYQVTKSSKSWVKFGLLIQSYPIPFGTGDSLVIKDSQTLLPISKVWVFVIGLLGRFGNRKDMGKVSKRRREKGIIAAQAVPGWGIPPTEDSMLEWMHNGPGWADRVYGGSKTISIHGNSYYQLCGLTGTLFIPRSRRQKSIVPIHFANHELDEIGNLDCEKLSIDRLFWLAVGCIPCEGDCVFSLDNVQLQDLGDDDETRSEFALPITLPITYNRPGFGDDDESVMFQYTNSTTSEGANDSEVSSDRYYRVTPLGRHRQPPAIPSPISGARAFRFSPTDQWTESLRRIARIFQVKQDNHTAMSLEEISVSKDIRAELESLAGVTYIPSDYMWVRLPPLNGSRGNDRSRRITNSQSQSAWYLRRSDAQVLAQALLRLPICRKGYLFNSNKPSLCYKFLCSAAPNAPHLLLYIIRYFDKLTIPEASRKSLLAAMEEMIRRTYKFQYSRAFMDSIYEIDIALQRVLLLDKKVINAVGVLAISNEEFRDLITMSIRRIPQSIDQTVQLDLHNPAIVIKAVLGAEQRFPVDLPELFPNFVASQRSIDISFTHLVLIVLKASVRSAFLKTSLDSSPLFERVMKMDDTVYIG